MAPLIRGRLIWSPMLIKDAAADSEPSQVIGLSLRRAGAGLIAAAWVQVIICLIVARSGYPAEFLLIISPLFFVLTAAGVIMLLGSDRPAAWLVVLCGLFAAFSLTATWFLRGRYTGGLNVAEPLIGLGVFGAAMLGDQWSQLAAAALIGLHRGALVLAGTGLPSEHALLALVECGSLVAAIVGSALVRRYARRLDGVEATLRDQIVSDASDSAEHTAFREWSRLLHDAPVHRLWQVAEGVAARVAADPAQFRRGCAQDAELLRGTVMVVEPDLDLVQALDGLMAYFDSLGLRILLTTRDTADYPADPAPQPASQPPVMPSKCTSAGPVVFAVSGRADSPPPVLTTTMQQAAIHAVDQGSSIGIVNVDGSPALTMTGAFSDPGVNHATLVNDQQNYLRSLLTAVERVRATSPDVNVLDVLEVGGRALHAACSHGGTLYLEDSGLQETGPVNFREPGMLGAAPADVVRFLSSEHEIPDLKGLAVVLVGIGDTAPPQAALSISQSSNLVAIWSAIASAGGAVSVSVDSSPRLGVAAPRHVPLVFIVRVPALPSWTPSDRRYVFPDSGPVGFLPDTAQFRDPAAAEGSLRQLAAYLVANPSARIELTGTTARFGSLSGCIALSLERADAVRQMLITDGALSSQIATAGVGWQFPGYENDQGPDGTLLPGPAEHNRSVIVTRL